MLQDLKHQFALIWLVSVSPRKSLTSLPPDRLLPLAFLTSSYFTFALAIRQQWFARIAASLGSVLLAFVILVAASFLAFCVVGAVLRVIVRIFGKRLSIRTVLNILGYSQAPRLILSVPLSILAAVLPSALVQRAFAGYLTFVGTALTCLGGILLLYGLVLLVLGLTETPDERRSPT